MKALRTTLFSILAFCVMMHAQATNIRYTFTVRDSSVTSGENRKTGLTPGFCTFKLLTDATAPTGIYTVGAPYISAGLTAPTITELNNGQYEFVYDPETNGEVAFQIDAGNTLSNYSDRFIDGQCVRDSSRILSGISSTGQVVASSVQGNVTGTVASVTGPVTLNSYDTFNVLNGTTVSPFSSTTLTLSGSPSTVNGTYVGEIVKLGGVTGAGQVRVITGYTYTGGVGTVTIGRAWTTTPDATTTYAILSLQAPNTDSNTFITANAVQGNITGNLSGSVGSLPAAPTGFLDATSITNIWGAGTRTLTSLGSVAPTWYVDPWTTLLTGETTAGSFGTLLKQFTFTGANVNSNVQVLPSNAPSTFLALTTAPSGWLDSTSINNIWSTAVPGSFAPGTAGKLLATAGSADPWQTLLTGETTAGSFGTLLKQFTFTGSNVNSNVQVLPSNAPSTFLALTTAPSGFLDTTSIGNIWGAATSGLTGAGSIGLLLTSNINATIASRQSGTAAVVLPATSPSGFLDTTSTNNIWSVALPGSFGTGSAGKFLSLAGAYTDPWATLLSAETTGSSFGTLVKQLTFTGSNVNANTQVLPTNAPSGFLTGTTAPAWATDPWQTLLTGETTAGSFGALLKQFTFTGSNVNSNVQVLPSTVLSSGDLTAIGTALMGVAVENGITFQQLLRAIGAYAAGNTNTTSHTYSALGNPSTTRLTYGIDSSGNRTLTLTLTP